jgi:hypothetical protein
MTLIMGHCPTCGAARNAHVIAEHEEILEPTKEPFDPTLQGHAYRILKCAGCNTIYFQRESLAIVMHGDPSDEGPTPDFQELKNYVMEAKEKILDDVLLDETIYWPAPSDKRERPDWSKLPDSILIKHLTSVYAALDNDLRVLAAIGMRVVFDRASELIGVDPSKNFDKKLDQLFRDGHISAGEKERLEVLTDAGGAAAHRGWEPSLEHLNTLTSITEHFVKSFILKEEAGKLKNSIPPRQKRRTIDDHGQSVVEFPHSKLSKNPPL